MLEHLNYVCGHNMMEQVNKAQDGESWLELSKVTIYKDFIEKYEKELLVHQNEVFEEYLKRIDSELLAELLERHIKEQTYKQCSTEMGLTQEEGKTEYEKVTESNLDYIESLFKNKKYIGEQNLGVMNFKILEHFGITYLNDDGFLDASILKRFGLPENTYSPIQTEESLFDMNILFNILYHNKKSFERLKPYKDEAIALGYLHPREYASLERNFSDKSAEGNMYLSRFWLEKENIDFEKINQKRKEFLLPSYEIDYEKHKLSHEHGIQLSFGFFKATR